MKILDKISESINLVNALESKFIGHIQLMNSREESRLKKCYLGKYIGVSIVTCRKEYV